jgi:parallel beta-helix repeat protein
MRKNTPATWAVRARRRGTVGLACGIVLASVLFLPPRALASATIRVPADYPTIQAAVDAANPGDTISVAAGTLSEQVTIGKNLTLTGAGADSTTIHAPATLVGGPIAGWRAIVTVVGGAQVAVSRLTVAGPGSQPCSSGQISGIFVGQDATLDLHFAAVRDIRATPVGSCSGPGAQAIKVGLDGRSTGGIKTTGHATIADDVISGYGHEGINVTNANSTATIMHNRISGIGGSPDHFVSGITVQRGATATIVGNTITDNHCTSPAQGCGPDPLNNFQDLGILVESTGPGIDIANNQLSGNDAGVALGAAPNCCSVSNNTLTGNFVAGYEVADGDQSISQDAISGGEVGVFVLADSVNTTVTLRNVSITGTSVAPTQTFSCCGFTARTVILGPGR